MIHLTKRDEALERRWMNDAGRDARNLRKAAAHTHDPIHKEVLLREAEWAQQGHDIRLNAIQHDTLPKLPRR